LFHSFYRNLAHSFASINRVAPQDQTAVTYSFTCPPLPDYSVCAFGEGVTAVDAGDRITWWVGKDGYGEDGYVSTASSGV
jgi:hypothetical protein